MGAGGRLGAQGVLEAMSIKRFDELQLRFDLELDEVDEDAQERKISYEDARKISEAARQLFVNQIGVPETPEWFKDYLRLVEQGWPWRVACYIAWASSPKLSRWPETLQELATQVLGLGSPRVIYTWKQRFPAIQTVVVMMQAIPLWEHRADVLKALVKMASTEDYKNFNDRKLFLEMVGDYTPKSQVEVGRSAQSLEEMSDEELDGWIGGAATTPTSPQERGASLAPLQEDEGDEE